MANGIQLIRASESRTTKWSGGTTTELAIFPEGSQYLRRDFGWRLSTATVEAEHTVFTKLPGIWRILMVTEGHLKLKHQGQHEVSLGPFDQDAFDGGWTTESWGQARDLNLMTLEAYESTMKGIAWGTKNPGYRELLLPVKTPGTVRWELLYGISGDLTIQMGSGWRDRLNRGDLLLVSREGITAPTELVATSEAASATGAAVRVSIIERG